MTSAKRVFLKKIKTANFINISGRKEMGSSEQQKLNPASSHGSPLQFSLYIRGYRLQRTQQITSLKETTAKNSRTYRNI